VLRIDVVNNTYSFFGDGLANDRNDEWSAAILGNDGCIYWPPITFSRAIKYDPETKKKFHFLLGMTLEIADGWAEQ